MEEKRNVGTNHKKNYEKAVRVLAIGSKTFQIERNRQIAEKFLRDAEAGKTILKGQKKKIGEGRLIKMLGLLILMDNSWLKKPFDEVTEEDMMTFILALEKGIIKSRKGKPYTYETQSTIKKFIRKFYKYLLGNNANYPLLVQFIDTSTKVTEVRAIPKGEADKLIFNASKIEHKFAIAFLFDSGARIEEFYNVKFSDLTRDDGYKVRIRISKTRPRTVNLPLFPDIMEEYLQNHPERNNPDAYIFSMSYCALKKMFLRLGKKVLNKNIYPHLLRHSSATYYSKYVSRYQLCYRYGWSASSKMPDRYVDMNGLIDDEVAQKYKTEETSKTKRENESLNNELSIMRTQLSDLIKKQEEAEIREQIMKKEQFILTALFNNKVGNSDENLRDFIKGRKDILEAISFIRNNIEGEIAEVSK